MTEEEEAFHRSRRMFVVLNKTIMYAPYNDRRSHEEWFKNYKCSDNWMTTFVRGFFDKRGVFLYQQTDGSKWDVTDLVIATAPYLAWSLNEFSSQLNLGVPKGHPLYGGMVPSIPGTLWTPKCNLGLKVGDILVPPKTT